MNAIIFLKPIAPECMFMPGPIGYKEGEVEVEVVTLNLEKVVNVWKAIPDTYSGIGGQDRKENKIAKIKESLDKTGSLYIPIIYITCDNIDNLNFVDGRHTTAVLFELGHQFAPFLVPRNQKSIFESLLT